MIDAPGVEYYHYQFGGLINHPGISEDPSKYTCEGGTALFDINLQMAIYMGFKDIYLLGCDSNRAGHVDSENIPSLKDSSLYRNIQAYAYLYEVAKKKKINIYNATRGGRLEVFPRVLLESIELKKM